MFIIKFHIVLIMKQREISDILDKQTLDDSPVIQTLIVGVNCEGKLRDFNLKQNRCNFRREGNIHNK